MGHGRLVGEPGDPRQDDVLIASRVDCWEVGWASGPPAFSCKRYDEACALVRGFAEAQGVDVWVVRPDGCVERIVRHRHEGRNGGDRCRQ